MPQHKPLTHKKTLAGIKCGVLRQAIIDALAEQSMSIGQLGGAAVVYGICCQDTVERWLAETQLNAVNVDTAERLATLLGLEIGVGNSK